RIPVETTEDEWPDHVRIRQLDAVEIVAANARKQGDPILADAEGQSRVPEECLDEHGRLSGVRVVGEHMRGSAHIIHNSMLQAHPMDGAACRGMTQGLTTTC